MSERLARQIVKQRADGRCELTGLATRGEVHHRVNRSQGGLWIPSNLLYLDPQVHSWVQQHPTLAAAAGWTVLTGEHPADRPCWLDCIFGKGWYQLTDEGAYSFCEEDPTTGAALLEDRHDGRAEWLLAVDWVREHARLRQRVVSRAR